MAKLPVLSARDCIAGLEKAGFYVIRQRGSHITMRRDNPPGRVTVPNHKELRTGMLRAIIRQAGLTVDEFFRPAVSDFLSIDFCVRQMEKLDFGSSGVTRSKNGLKSRCCPARQCVTTNRRISPCL
jgi:predicted RNA binding protein YcfA (HicA-like mRNA interferase family)